MSLTLPCIEVHRDMSTGLGDLAEGDPLGSLVRLLATRGARMDRLTRQLVLALVTEGRRFRATESGQRWEAVLGQTQLVTNGWMLWNMLDLDRHVTRDDALAGDDTPSAMLDDLLRQLQSTKLEQLVQLMSSVWGSEPQHV